MIRRRQISEPWRRIGATVWYLPVAALLLAASLVPALHHWGTDLGGVSPRPLDALALAAIGLECGPLATRRRWPVASLVVVSLGFAIDQLRGYHSLAGTALPIALLSVAALLGHHRRVTALAFSVAYLPLAIALTSIGSGESPAGFAGFYLVLALVWGIGSWWRTVRTAEAERRRQAVEDTRAAERTRIARELHDVVTHHVTAMVVQTEAARYLTGAPERLDQTLTAVTDTGRRAITDLRHLLDLLNPSHDTESRSPTVGRLQTLVDQTRQAGQPVEFTEDGTPAESSGSADLMAYRVVQEALTNALKYAQGSSTGVRVRYGEREIMVEVDTDGGGADRGGGTGFAVGSGRGLAGLRDRVGVLGGDFSAGRRLDGGFEVRARIPARSGS